MFCNFVELKQNFLILKLKLKMDTKKIIRYVLIAAVVFAFFYGSYYALTHMGDASMGDGSH